MSGLVFPSCTFVSGSINYAHHFLAVFVVFLNLLAFIAPMHAAVFGLDRTGLVPLGRGAVPALLLVQTKKRQEGSEDVLCLSLTFVPKSGTT